MQLSQLQSLQYETEAQKLWQQALTACTAYTDASLVLQVHKLLHTPGAIASTLQSNGLQPARPQSEPTAQGAAMVCNLTCAAALSSILHCLLMSSEESWLIDVTFLLCLHRLHPACQLQMAQWLLLLLPVR